MANGAARPADLRDPPKPVQLFTRDTSNEPTNSQVRSLPEQYPPVIFGEYYGDSSDPELRGRITAITDRVESFHKFADWLAFGNK